jgi:hypothetical protein
VRQSWVEYAGSTPVANRKRSYLYVGSAFSYRRTVWGAMRPCTAGATCSSSACHPLLRTGSHRRPVVTFSGIGDNLMDYIQGAFNPADLNCNAAIHKLQAGYCTRAQQGRSRLYEHRVQSVCSESPTFNDQPMNSSGLHGGPVELAHEPSDCEWPAGGPKLRKWYGETEKLTGPKGRGPSEGPDEEEDQYDGPRNAVLVTDADRPLGELLVLQLVLSRCAACFPQLLTNMSLPSLRSQHAYMSSAFMCSSRTCRTRIRVLVKDLVKAKQEFGPYIEPVRGDVSNAAALREAMRGVRAVVVIGPVGMSMRAAADARVEHVVLASCIGELPLIDTCTCSAPDSNCPLVHCVAAPGLACPTTSSRQVLRAKPSFRLQGCHLIAVQSKS